MKADLDFKKIALINARARTDPLTKDFAKK